MNIKDLFSRAMSAFKKTSDSTKAYNDLNEGKQIVYSPKSDRYTYGNQQDTDYNKNWTPETKEEKETLSPQGYFRVGERAEAKEQLKSGIFESALNKARAEDKERIAKLKEEGKRGRKTSEKKLEEQARQEADKQFDEEYNEKQVSVDSTAIAKIDYDPKSEGLKVRFVGGDKDYFFPAVPLEVVQQWLKAPSKGEFFRQKIFDQYSMYGSDHRKKTGIEQAGIKKYMKSYFKANKGKWN